MADILEWTTTEAVRGALGVTDNEVPDSFLLHQNMHLQLEHDLDSWFPLRGDLDDGDDADIKTLRGLRLYSMWFCAALTADMWLAFPQRISDGKADLRRFTALDFEELSLRAAAKRDAYRNALDPNPPETNLIPHVAGAAPSYDPVTNTES